VIFEVNWRNKKELIDSNYKILIGSLYERLKGNFPDIEILPTANLSDEILLSGTKIIQYRFWSKGKMWPVVQLGPGVITVNMNKDYNTWESFKPVIEKVVNTFLEIYPNKDDLIIENLALKYLDAFLLDYKANFLDYLSEKLHTYISIDFGDDKRKEKISHKPSKIDFSIEYELIELKGKAGIRFFNAVLEEKEHLIMESYAILNHETLYKKENILDWLDVLHDITDFIFTSLIRGK
ncbi:MAG: TIGR04255 family protein, partial [candidate division WOR-3 bacterium]